ncbi:MFS transporter [Streptomyces albus]|uniref:MFS transporter n=1 Tax=Streptomyces albus TaxID=1888 RepID=UPI0004CAF108|nr:MFS transporter [Streptomyces albus]
MTPGDLRRDRIRVPAALSTGLLLNAAFAGLMSVTLPLWLADRGHGKGGIAAFFLLTAVTAAALNLLVGRRVRNWARVVRTAAAVSVAGLAALSYLPWSWTVFPAGAATMAMSLVYPQYMAAAQQLAGPASELRVVAQLRTLYVTGYVAGLGLFSVVSALDGYAAVLRPVNWGLLIGAVIALLRRPTVPPPVPADGATGEETGARSGEQPGERAGEPAPAGKRSVPAGTGLWVLGCAVTAIVLLRAADSLRGVYLPLYVLHSGWSEQWVSILFAVTVIVEIAVLRPLGRVGGRYRDGAVLALIAVIGGVSFLLVVIGGGRPVLLISQIVYAVFTAGFQAVGMTLLGRLLKTGAVGGASLYTAAVQIGSAAGVLAPLAVSGYSSATFAIAAAFCAVSCLLLVLVPPDRAGRRTGRWRDRTPAGAATASR